MDLRGTIQQINAVSCCLDASLKNDQFEPKIFAIGDRNEIYVVLRLHKNMKGHVENMEIIPFNVETGMLEPMTFETMREKMQRKLDSSLGEEEKVYLRGLYNGCLAENVKFNRLIVIPDEVAAKIKEWSSASIDCGMGAGEGYGGGGDGGAHVMGWETPMRHPKKDTELSEASSTPDTTRNERVHESVSVLRALRSCLFFEGESGEFDAESVNSAEEERDEANRGDDEKSAVSTSGKSTASFT